MNNKITTHQVGKSVSEVEDIVLDETPTTKVVFRSLIHNNGIRGFIFRFIKNKDGNKRTVIVKPNTIEDKDGNKSYVVGIGIDNTVKRGFVSSITYAGETTVSLYKLMLTTIKQLFTGGVSAKDLSGPVGIYSIVDSQAKQGFQNIMYLTAYLSMNVGVINLLPFPAFDGGRVLFLIIEKIRRKPVPAKTEAMVNSIGFMLLMLLMVYVTFNDILRLF